MKKLYVTLCALLFSLISFAALSYNTTLTETVFNNSKSNAVGAVDWEGGIRLGFQRTFGVQMPGNWDEKSVVVALATNSVPYQLSFKLHGQWPDLTNVSTATKTDYKVFESPDNSNWTEAFSANYCSEEESSTYTASLKKSTRYLKFFYSGNYSGTFSAVLVTDQKYIYDPSSDHIDFGTKALGADTQTESVSIEWCNLPQFTITQLHPEFFTVSPTSFGAQATFGTANIEVQYGHDVLGEHRDTLTITNGEYTKYVYIVGATDRRPQQILWNEALSSTGFVLTAGEALPNADVAVIATATNGGQVTYTTSNASIISVSTDGTQLTAVGNGTAEITAYQAGDDHYAPASATQTFTVTSATKQSITWNDDLLSLQVGGEPFHLSAFASSNGPIAYSVDDNSVVSVSDGVLTIVGEGETVITATQEGGVIGGETYAPISVTKVVVVINPANGCTEYALNNSGFDLSSSSREFTLAGAPSVVRFHAYHDTKSGSWGQVSYAALIVEEYATRNGVTEWYTVFNEIVAESSQAYGQNGQIPLTENATKIRFRTGETATTHISNIYVIRKPILTASVTEINEEVECNTLYSKTITIRHQSIDKLRATVTGPFTLDKTLIGSGCSDIANDELTISFMPTEKTTYTGTLTITDGKTTNGHTIEIPITITATGLRQLIQDWTLDAEFTGFDNPIALNAVATSGLAVEYSSSNTDVARIENGTLIAVAPGTAVITASQPGNDKFDPAPEVQKTVTINYADATITTAPTANTINYGEALSLAILTGGEANVQGSFRWELAPETILPVGEHALNVIFDAAQPALFDADTTQIVLTVRPAITYGEQLLTICAGDSIEYHGVWYKQAVSTQITILNVLGGDSIIDLTVAVNPVFNTPISAVICAGEEYPFAGKQLTEKGTYVDSLKSVDGCDSVVVLDLNVADKYIFPETHIMYVGEADTWHGKDLSVYGVGVHTIYDSLKTEVYGCDSVYVLTLTVNVLPTSSEDLEAIVCPGDSIEHDGKFYKVGEHELRYQNIYGGDSVINLIVSETQTYFFTDTRTQYAGKAGDWRGKDLSVYGVGEHFVYDSLKTEVHGCDSVYRLTLTIEALPTSESAVSAKVCPGETIEFDGNRFGAGVHALHYTNVLGGDSTVTLTVSLYPTYEANPEILEIFEHANETWNGHDLSVYEVGVYSILDTLPTVNGCDSVVSLELWVNELPTTYGSDGATICPGEKFVYQDSTLTEARKYRFTLVNGFGGDSIVTFTLKHYQAYSVEQNQTITFGDPAIVWHEQTIENLNAGNYTYIDTLPTINGCDSICTFHLTVNKAPQTIIWENTLPDTLMVGETAPLAPAESSVGLEISYHVSGEAFAEWNGTEVLAIAAGTITVTASQPGNENYLPAEPISVSLVIDEVTALEDLIINDMQARKLMHNGVIYILRNNAIYDLNGQRIR